MLTLTQTLDVLRQLGCHPKKFLGQNFLIDPNIVRKSLSLAELQAQDTVVEVGPGLGTLTADLLECAAKVYAIEYDRCLCDHLERTLGEKFGNNFYLLRGDAVAFPIAQKPELEAYKIVANLPYAISTPWMDAVLRQKILPLRMVLLLQRETAERFFAKDHTKAMGPIAIFLQSLYDMKEMHPVSRKCFFPEPDIDSALLSMQRKACPIFFPPKVKSIIRRFFTERRKQMRHLTKKYGSSAMADEWLSFLQSQGIPVTARPEDIPIALWAHLESMGSLC